MENDMLPHEKLLKQKVQAVLEDMSEKEKIERCLIPFVPAIPSTEKERRALVKGFVNGALEDYYSSPELRVKILDSLQLPYLDNKKSIPRSKLRVAILQRVEQLTPEQQLHAGVFGTPSTREDLDRIRRWNENYFYDKLVLQN